MSALQRRFPLLFTLLALLPLPFLEVTGSCGDDPPMPLTGVEMLSAEPVYALGFLGFTLALLVLTHLAGKRHLLRNRLLLGLVEVLVGAGLGYTVFFAFIDATLFEDATPYFTGVLALVVFSALLLDVLATTIARLWLYIRDYAIPRWRNHVMQRSMPPSTGEML